MWRMKQILLHFQAKKLFNIFKMSFLLVVLIEILSRRSLVEVIEFINQSPMVFVYNIVLVALSFSIVIVTLRQTYSFFLISFFWMLIAGVNMIVRTYRMTPLTLDDVQFIANLTTIMPIYLTIFQIMLVLMLGVLVCIGLGIMFVKSTPQKRFFKIGALHFGLVSLLIVTLPMVSPSIARFEESDSNLRSTFDEFGFTFSFVRSALERGIDQPNDFNETELLEKIKALNTYQYRNEQVNVIAVQLESFFDVNRLTHLNLTQNPIPTFTRLKSEFSSGTLVVPTIGGGTANSEFEFITSMDLNHFGIGEFPYKTVLQYQSLPSLVSHFNQLNYRTTAIHNNSANFYRRHVVFRNLGFNAFEPLETMTNVSTTTMGWARDIYLLPSIQTALLSSNQKDFIFAVSVQAHGEYPDSPLSGSMIEFVPSTESNPQNHINFYLNQINEVDAFIYELETWVMSLDEPTMLVLYGDHLPGIDFGLDSTMEYLSDYVIVTNFETEVIHENLTLPQLGARALMLINHRGTTLHYLHQKQSKDAQLFEWIHYDWVSGNRVSMDPLLQPLYMQIGLKSPKVYETVQLENDVLLIGENFHPNHIVVVNGEIKETTFISPTQIRIESKFEGMYTIEFAIRSDNRELIKIRQ